MKKENKIVVLVGKSCSGKDTTARMLETEYSFKFVVSTTTRPMRQGESEGNPYHFVTNEQFKNKIENDEMIEFREYHTLVNNIPSIWYYGAEKNEINDNQKYVAVLDIIGLEGFKKAFPDRVISFFLDVDDNIRKQRCIFRGDFDETEWNRRLIDDNNVFRKEIIEGKVDWVINELNIEIAVSTVMDIIQL